MKGKLKVPQDLMTTRQNLTQAMSEGFDFDIKEDDKVIDCTCHLALLSWLVERRPLLTSNDYIINNTEAVAALAKKIFSELRIEFTDIFGPLSNLSSFLNKMTNKVFTSSKIGNLAATLLMLSIRFKFPIGGGEPLHRICDSIFELLAMQTCKCTTSDYALLEIFSEKSVTCCVNFMEDCMNGVDFKEAQQHLNLGIFTIMRLDENQSRHLSKEGRQFMRFTAVLLYKLYAQHSCLQYGKTFRDIDLHTLMQTAGIGRVEWMYDYLTGVFNEEDTRYIALCALHCEPNGYVIKVSEKKIEEYSRLSRIYQSIGLYENALRLALTVITLEYQASNFYTDAVNEAVSKATVELGKRTEELNIATADLKDRKNEIRSLNRQLETLSTDCSVLVNENASLLKKLEDLSGDDTLKNKDNLILELQNTIYEYEQDIQSYSGKLEAARTRIQNLETKSSSYSDNAVELEKYKNRVKDLEETLESFVKEDVGVSFEEVSNYCRGIKPFIIGGLKGLDNSLNKVFADYVYYNIENGSAELVVPTNIDCVIVYTRFVGHQHVNSVRSRMPDNIPYIPLNNSNPDLIRKTVYKAMKVKD